MPQVAKNLRNNAHLCIHTRTPRNTTLHHPSTSTLTTHNKSPQFRTQLDQSCNCLYHLLSVDTLCGFFVSQQENGSWQLLVVAELGDSGEGRVVGQVGGCHQQEHWVTKQQCSPTCCGPQARGSNSKLCPWQAALGREHGRMSVRTVAIRFTMSRTCSRKIRCLRLRPLLIRTVLHLEGCHIRDRRKFAEGWRGWRLHLEGVSRARSQRVDGWIWKWFASALRKFSKPCTELHDQVTLHSPNTLVMACANVQRRTNSTSMFGVSSWIVTLLQHQSSKRICGPRVPFCEKWTLT